MGSARNEMAPTSVRMIEMTPAKIGLSMKKWENRMAIVLHSAADTGMTKEGSLSGGGFDLAIFCRDLLSRPGALHTIDDDAIGGCEARADHAETIDHRAQVDQLRADRAVFGDREDDLA